MPSARVATMLRVGALLLLVAAHVGAWCVLLRPELDLFWLVSSAIESTLFVSQSVLLAAWIVAGPGAWWWRWPLCGVLGLVAGVLLWPVSDLLDWPHLAWTGVATVVVGAGLIIARLAGVDLVRGTRGRPAPWQFSIRSLLAWTALIAVVIGLARVMHAAPIWTEPDAFAQQQMIAFGLLGMTSALIAATAIWATLPVGRLWWRLVLLAILAPAAMVLSRYMMGVTLGESVTSIDWFWILFGWLQAVILAGTLLVVRGCGYRLIKRRKSVWQWLSGRVRKQPSDGPPALPAEVAP